MTVLWAVAVLCLGAAFLLRAAGSAVTRIARADALRDAADGTAGAADVARLLEKREFIPSAVGVVGSALLVVAAVTATVSFVDTGNALAVLARALLVAFVVFGLGDLAPRALGRRVPVLAYRLARPLDVAVGFGAWANDLLPEGQAVADSTPDEPNGEQERDLISSVLEFSDTIVREVMTPRPDMVTVETDTAIPELLELASDEGFSRLPVFNGDDVSGVVIVKDLLPRLAQGATPRSVLDVMRAVEFVPETKHVSDLLSEMQASHTHLAMVVDEFGDVVGLVSIEDLLEELVGEIADETDEEEPMITTIAGGGWSVDARLSVEELVDAIGVDLPDGEWDTVGGLVLGLAGRVPEPGEMFTHGALRLEVARMQGRRVAEVRVIRLTGVA